MRAARSPREIKERKPTAYCLLLAAYYASLLTPIGYLLHRLDIDLLLRHHLLL